MDTKKLEALLTAVELGSFTRAAEVLGYTQSGLTHMMNSLEKDIGCYEMTLVKGEIACQKQIFEQGHVRRAETIRIPALATLLYVDWLPQVNGPPGALLSSVVDHESAIIVNT